MKSRCTWIFKGREVGPNVCFITQQTLFVCVGEAVLVNIKNLYPCMLMEWDCVLLCQCFSYSHHSYKKKENLINFQHLISMQGWVQHWKHSLAVFVYNSSNNAKKVFFVQASNTEFTYLKVISCLFFFFCWASKKINLKQMLTGISQTWLHDKPFSTMFQVFMWRDYFRACTTFMHFTRSRNWQLVIQDCKMCNKPQRKIIKEQNEDKVQF